MGSSLLKVLLSVEQLRRRVPGGIGTYAESCLRALSQMREADSIRSTGANSDALAVSLFASAPKRGGADPLDQYGFPILAGRLPQRLSQALWDLSLFGPDLTDFDVYHSFSMGGPRSLRPGTKAVFALYDLAWIKHPEAFPKRGRRWHDRALRDISNRADAVVTLSEFSSTELSNFGIAKEKIHVIPPGADHLAVSDRQAASKLLESLGVKGPFLLSVSTIEPRKNLARLVEAYGMFKMDGVGPIDLVIVGPDGWMTSDTGRPPGVKLAGRVEASVLSALYGMAEALAYVPLYEGFGMPVLEANASCVPVVASNVPAAHGSALVVDPLSVDSIAAGLSRIVSDSRLRSELVSAGLLKATESTWNRAAQAHVDLWSALGRP